MGRQATPAELIRYAKWYFPIAGVLCTAAVFLIRSQQSPWAQIGTGFVVVSIVGFFPLAGNLMAAGVAAVMGALAPELCNLIHRLCHLVLPEPGGKQITRSDFDMDFAPGRMLFWYGIVLLVAGVLVAGLCIAAAQTGNSGLRDGAIVIGILVAFPLIGGLWFSVVIAGLFSMLQIAWMAGRIVAWLMRIIAPQSSPLSGLCAAGLLLASLFGWICMAAEIPPDEWKGRAAILAITFGGFLMLIWPLADAQKSSLPALILVAAGSAAIGISARKVSPAAALFFALACFLLVEAFRKTRSDPASKTAMTVRIAASVVLGAALEGGILLYAAYTRPREPEALAPPDPEKTLVER